MGKAVIILKNGHYPDEEDMRRLIFYVAGKGKDSDKKTVSNTGAFGLSRKPEKFFGQLKKLHRYLSPGGNRNMYHLIVSFPGCITSTDLINKTAREISGWIYTDLGHPLIYAVHTDTANLHIHIAFYSVSLITGKKWHQNNSETAGFKKRLLQVINGVFVSNGFHKLDL